MQCWIQVLIRSALCLIPILTLCICVYITDSPAKRSISARFQVAMELLQTERNYVGILSTILNVSYPSRDHETRVGYFVDVDDMK